MIQREVKSVVTGVALVIVCSFINEKNLNYLFTKYLNMSTAYQKSPHFSGN